MSRVTATGWHRNGRAGATSKFEGRKGLIARAARTCMERKGVAKTSIADITREVDITRELFYYYFPNKNAVVGAVLDSYVSDASALFERTILEADGDPASLLLHMVKALRSWLATDGDMPVSMIKVMCESGAGTKIVFRVADEAVAALRGTALLGEREPAEGDDDLGRTMGFVGAMGAMRTNADLTDEQVAYGLAPLFGL